MRQSFHPKMFDDHDETSFVPDSDAVNMRIELVSQSSNPEVSPDHRENPRRQHRTFVLSVLRDILK